MADFTGQCHQFLNVKCMPIDCFVTNDMDALRKSFKLTMKYYNSINHSKMGKNKHRAHGVINENYF